MKSNKLKTSWSITRWHRSQAESSCQKVKSDPVDLVGSYGKLRLIVNNRPDTVRFCPLDAIADLTHELVCNQKPVKKTDFEVEIYKKLV